MRLDNITQLLIKMNETENLQIFSLLFVNGGIYFSFYVSRFSFFFLFLFLFADQGGLIIIIHLFLFFTSSIF